MSFQNIKVTFYSGVSELNNVYFRDDAFMTILFFFSTGLDVQKTNRCPQEEYNKT